MRSIRSVTRWAHRGRLDLAGLLDRRSGGVPSADRGLPDPAEDRHLRRGDLGVGCGGAECAGLTGRAQDQRDLLLPDKNLTLIYERGAGAVGPARCPRTGSPGRASSCSAPNDSLGNPWRAATTMPTPTQTNGPGVPVATGCALAELGGYLAPYADASTVVFDANNLPAILTDTMTISAKAYFASPGLGFEEVDLVKDVKASQFVSARLAASGFLSLGAATGRRAARQPAGLGRGGQHPPRAEVPTAPPGSGPGRVCQPVPR